MYPTRRQFIRGSALGALGSSLPFASCRNHSGTFDPDAYEKLNEARDKKVLNTDYFSSPIRIKELQLLRYKHNFICRVRSQDGAEGISISNNMQMISLYPIFLERLQPFFIGKDATRLEELLEEVYVYKSNYKLQSLALWVPLATIEFAILDMLGKYAGKSTGELIGTIHNTNIGVYQANNFRGRTAEESIELIKEKVSNAGARALKFKVAGRMSNPEQPPGRSETLIPLVRKAFGDEMVIYADANGGYNDVREAIRIGRLMEQYRYDFFEEPVPFDWYEETKMVADNITIPVAGGEQEPSLHNFRWLIGNDALQVVQPDIFYFGGMIRSMKVARMAAVQKKQCTPHISGSGLGYLYMMHFVSALPNAGPFHEFKGFNKNLPMECPTSDLTVKEGKIKVPTGPGMGVIIDPGFIGKHTPVDID